jgi:PAS domain S-box-containing protein
MIELLPDSIVAVDTKGVILQCNAAAARISGYSKEELVGKHFSKLRAIRVRDMPKYLNAFSSILRGKAHKPFELTFYTSGWNYHSG